MESGNRLENFDFTNSLFRSLSKITNILVVVNVNILRLLMHLQGHTSLPFFSLFSLPFLLFSPLFPLFSPLFPSLCEASEHGDESDVASIFGLEVCLTDPSEDQQFLAETVLNDLIF